MAQDDHEHLWLPSLEHLDQDVASPHFRKTLNKIKALTPSKQIGLIELLQCALWATTPEGVRVTARHRKELGRFTNQLPGDAMVDWVRSFEPGDVFYDIGANCGGVTLRAAGIHGDRVQIVAIEPGFGNFESLARNLSSNGFLGFAIPLQVALLDHSGLQPLYYNRGTHTGGALHAVGESKDHLGQPFQAAEVQMIPAYALDDLIAMLKLPAPTRIKIDVDGYEEKVLRGSPRTLASPKLRDLVVEVVDHDRAGTRYKIVVELLAAAGMEFVRSFDHGEGGFVADHLFRRRATSV